MAKLTNGHGPPVGQRVLPTHIDQVAREDPDRVFCSIVSFNGNSVGLQDITMASFASAINRASWWLEDTLGKPSGFPTIAYMGPSDPRYQIFATACMKVGYKMLVPSPRTSTKNQISLLKATDCRVLLKAGSTRIDDQLCAEDVRCIVIPELDHFLDRDPVTQYPFNKTFEEVRNDLVAVLHSSGSTGVPKPIFFTHSSVCTLDNHNLYRSSAGEKTILASLGGNRMFSLLPFFHVSTHQDLKGLNNMTVDLTENWNRALD